MPRLLAGMYRTAKALLLLSVLLVIVWMLIPCAGDAPRWIVQLTMFLGAGMTTVAAFAAPSATAAQLGRILALDHLIPVSSSIGRHVIRSTPSLNHFSRR